MLIKVTNSYEIGEKRLIDFHQEENTGCSLWLQDLGKLITRGICIGGGQPSQKEEALYVRQFSLVSYPFCIPCLPCLACSSCEVRV